MKRALITGISGQDGSYLAEYLLELGYEVHGTTRMLPWFADNLSTIVSLVNKIWTNNKVKFHYADLRDEVSLEKVIRKAHPDEIYNLAGQTFVPTSWTQPAETFDVNVGGLARILKITEKICPKAKVYQASTSEMYGNVALDSNAAVDEFTSMSPVSPYGVSKLSAHRLVDAYRQKGMFVVSGILFNHESPRRGDEMVTRKITKHVANWMCEEWTELRLGNPNAKRDWGFAGDYVKAMHLMLQQTTSEDFVIGTGRAFSVKDFYEAAVAASGILPEELPIVWNAEEFTRAGELRYLLADYSKAKKKLGWKPTTSFEELVRMMVEHDYKRCIKNELVNSK